MLDGQTDRASVNKKIYLWPGGIVPYILESSLSTYIFVCKLCRQYILAPGLGLDRYKETEKETKSGHSLQITPLAPCNEE